MLEASVEMSVALERSVPLGEGLRVETISGKTGKGDT